MRAFLLLLTLSLISIAPVAAAEPVDPTPLAGKLVCTATPERAPGAVRDHEELLAESSDGLLSRDQFLGPVYSPRYYCEATMRDAEGTRGIDIELPFDPPTRFPWEPPMWPFA